MNTQKIKWKLIVTVLAVSLLAAVYIGISYFYTTHFFPRTTVSGRDVGGYSLQQLKDEITAEIHSYALTIQPREGREEKLYGSDIGLEPMWEGKIESFLNRQNAFSWPAEIFRKKELRGNLLVSYDAQRLDFLVDGLFCMDEKNQTAPKDADVVFQDKTGQFEVSPCVMGTEIDKEQMYVAVALAIGGLQESLSLEESGVYVNPRVYEDDGRLKEAAEKMNDFAKAEITFEMGKKTQVLDVHTFKDWIKLNKKLKPVIDKEKVAGYVSDLAAACNTCYSKKKLKTSYGVTVEIEDSHYGWKVDCEKEKKQIVSEIRAGKAVTREPGYLMTANSHGKNDYGNSYVEINLTSQHLFLYKKGKLVLDTDFVSGNLAKNHGTPTGAYGITYTQKDATLRGEDYETPVDYWMPFAGNVGMHDASWRSRFGGNIYKYEGSHGCVNLPADAAKKIFANVGTNYPVLVYELAGSEKMKPEKKKPNSRKEVK